VYVEAKMDYDILGISKYEGSDLALLSKYSTFEF
jgi:hypothetical protein